MKKSIAYLLETDEGKSFHVLKAAMGKADKCLLEVHQLDDERGDGRARQGDPGDRDEEEDAAPSATASYGRPRHPEEGPSGLW